MSRRTGSVDPRATLRLQLHEGYTLDDARSDLPYFARLGISHLYLSPVSRSRRGSTHGYDVVDHEEVDPARGGEAALRRLADEAHASGMGLLLDIVPNHMATDPDNAWWWDVLQHGRESPWAGWFDIDWEAPQCRGKLLAPFLEKHYADALRCGDIRLRHTSSRGFHVTAHEVPYPLAGGVPETGADIDEVLRAYDPASPEGRRRLHELLEAQHYRLSWWRCAADAINWRRFFEVSGLIGVRVERDDVFEAVHRLPLQLYAQGVLDGLRVDHVDGLARPLEYCRRLREAMVQARGGIDGDSTPWVVVEKILAEGETLDERWAVSGTTGYDFMSDAAAVLHDGRGEAVLTDGWMQIAKDDRPAEEWVVAARKQMLERHFAAERNALLDALVRLAGETVDTRDWTRAAIGRVLDALLRHFPTYRSYVEDGRRTEQDQPWFDKAVRGALAAGERDRDTPYESLLRLLDGWLGGEKAASNAGSEAIQRFQQLTPPLAAKALEDTVFYRYGRLLSRNDVGSDPSTFALPVAEFHARNLHRATASPLGLLATATHDHKRGEDVRARLAVLSGMPEDWLQACHAWLGPDEDNEHVATEPARAFKYMLVQTLVGAWPPDLNAHDKEGVEAYLKRVGEWAIKALREGKQWSGWFCPDEAHEAACLAWIDSFRPGAGRHGMLCDIEAFVRRIEPGAIFNGLVQGVLRMTSPGIPDLYQGTEFRDFSLVDPDNRRPVDFNARSEALRRALQPAPDRSAPKILPVVSAWPAEAWADGRVKQALIATLLWLRREHATAFSGGYEPLEITGECEQNVLAFCRGNDIVVAAAVNAGARVTEGKDGMPTMPAHHWGAAGMTLPGGHTRWRDVLRNRPLPAGTRSVAVADLFDGLPLAVLCRDQG